MVSDVYDSRMRASDEIRSRASRSEISRAWSETVRSRGASQLGDVSNEELEQDCALPAAVRISDARNSAIVRHARAGTSSGRFLRTSSSSLSPVENGDVSLPLDAGTE